MQYDALIVGGGMAGLTAATYLSKSGAKILLCEKEDELGGLVRTFQRNGFTYDGGIRAFENSGVLFPMLKQLGIDLPLVPNRVTLGIEDRVIPLESMDSIRDYEELLIHFYPHVTQEIHAITQQMQKIMHYMDVQYGINNPLFLDIKQDRDYFVKVVFPWIFKYAITSPKISSLTLPVVDFLRQFTNDQSLLDIITQHFFQRTPAFFALSYLKLYLDYYYPLGGTSQLVHKLQELILQYGGEIRSGTPIITLDPQRQVVFTASGENIAYHHLVWAADLKTFYDLVDPLNLQDEAVQAAFIKREAELTGKYGCDSVFTLFLAVDLDPSYFAQKASAHFFYTPHREGQTQAGPLPLAGSRQDVETWLERFYELTTYEMSIPVLRDASLAPAGKTGLIISMLFDYQLTRHIKEQGWYGDFKTLSQRLILKTLDSSIFPGLSAVILDQFSSTPLTMQRITGTLDGAITGWAFTNNPFPAENRLPRVANAIKTPLPHVVQAGQWTFSPSGFPTALITGKMAADQISKEIKKNIAGEQQRYVGPNWLDSF
ncbi:MAG: NAD(P)/FAD-dependent oxidoreductase [Chloroflexi bacterium]|nr:NAD(P)/FAD-dependent oxidoreductase [Chloroflexota bacterium]